MGTFKYNLGDKLKHSISGLIGVVTGRAEYDSGRLSYLLTLPNQLNQQSGLPIEDWFAEAQLELAINV